ncbi:MAG: hypothetical protein U0R72_14075 [Nakamurella multipartita]
MTGPCSMSGNGCWSAGGDPAGHAHPDWDVERVRTAVHGAFGMLNAVGTFESPLPDDELAHQMSELAVNALQVRPGDLGELGDRHEPQATGTARWPAGVRR